jgi:hypothetical protein
MRWLTAGGPAPPRAEHPIHKIVYAAALVASRQPEGCRWTWPQTLSARGILLILLWTSLPLSTEAPVGAPPSGDPGVARSR